jgi:hypothetical protein
MSDIKDHLDYIVKKMMWSGYLPKKDKGDAVYLVQVCHGSPGAIPMLATAIELFPDMLNVC